VVLATSIIAKDGTNHRAGLIGSFSVNQLHASSGDWYILRLVSKVTRHLRPPTTITEGMIAPMKEGVRSSKSRGKPGLLPFPADLATEFSVNPKRPCGPGPPPQQATTHQSDRFTSHATEGELGKLTTVSPATPFLLNFNATRKDYARLGPRIVRALVLYSPLSPGVGGTF
jgi:hypothetical protein